MKKTLQAALLTGAALAAAACNGSKERLQYVEEPVEVIYNKAVEAMERKRYDLAVQLFDEVERQHPYSVWARRAMLMAAYVNYDASKFDEAIAASERFLALHPGNKDAPYAYYLIAVCEYERILDVGRDQATTREAEAALQEVVRRFPDTDYARDARLKLDLVHDHLAGKELDVGRFYLRRGHFVAAINRFRTVVEDYQTTSHVPEALHRLSEAYMALGLEEEATRAAAVLGHNFPGGDWYSDSYRLVQGGEPVEDEDESESRGIFAALFNRDDR